MNKTDIRIIKAMQKISPNKKLIVKDATQEDINEFKREGFTGIWRRGEKRHNKASKMGASNNKEQGIRNRDSEKGS